MQTDYSKASAAHRLLAGQPAAAVMQPQYALEYSQYAVAAAHSLGPLCLILCPHLGKVMVYAPYTQHSKCTLYDFEFPFPCEMAARSSLAMQHKRVSQFELYAQQCSGMPCQQLGRAYLIKIWIWVGYLLLTLNELARKAAYRGSRQVCSCWLWHRCHLLVQLLHDSLQSVGCSIPASLIYLA